jgi:selenocysteine-specific elongation factor
LISSQNFRQLCDGVIAAVTAHHRQEPLSRGLARETLRERQFGHSAPEIFRAVLGRLEQQGTLVAEKDLVRIREHTLNLSPADAQLRDRVAAIYEMAGLEAPSIDEALSHAGVPATQRTQARKVLQLLIDGSVLVRVQGDLLFHREALENLVQRLHAFGEAHEPERVIDVAQFKDLAGVSRKYAIPLLEYLDRTRVTIRAGDRRVIAKPKPAP